MSTDGVKPEPDPSDITSEPIEDDLAGDPTAERGPSGRTYDDETPAAEVESRGGGVPDEVDDPGATGLAGLDIADPGRHQV